MHEAQTAQENSKAPIASSFVTLTYDEEHLPADRGLVLQDFQNFAKRLRKNIGPFRYLHCGEYGPEKLRPHYHACIFGIPFGDRVKIELQGKPAFTSPTLSETWGKGYVTVGDIEWASAKYVANYCVSKLNGQGAETAAARNLIQQETGEVLAEWKVQPEYATMSRNPGLGKEWFKKYWTDVYPDDFVLANGHKFTPPGYYDKLLEKQNPELWEKVKLKRQQKIREKQWDLTPKRLSTRERIAQAKYKEYSQRQTDTH